MTTLEKLENMQVSMVMYLKILGKTVLFQFCRWNQANMNYFMQRIFTHIKDLTHSRI